jgi:Derlin-2/3
MAGPTLAAQSVAGAAVGHLWWWSVWGGRLGSQGIWSAYASAPEWLRNLIGERDPSQPPTAGGTAAGLARGGVHVTAPRRPAAPGGSSTTTGYSWGSGQRLGDS